MNKKNEYSIFYIIILISILISSLLLLNYYFEIKQKEKEKEHISKKELIKKLNIFRNLDFASDGTEICSRSSDDLVKYFQTGDTNYVELYRYDEDVEPSEIIISLINILSGEGNSKENNETYGNHLLPMIIFLLLGILCIPGWIIFCSCAYCKCKCYESCKNIKCKTPFFIIVTIVNVVFAIISIIGFVKIKPIFEGLSNTECSIFRFISEILDGETKNNLPKWGGVSEIINIFDKTVKEIDKMSSDTGTLTSTEQKRDSYNNAVDTFITQLKTACVSISIETSYEYTTDTNYILDMANNFGKYLSGNSFTEGSYADKWVQELEISDDVGEYYNKLGLIIQSNINEHMKYAESIFQDIGEGIEQLKDNIGKKILEYSDKIDNIGNIILKLIFSFLLIISILLESFLILLLLSASRQCNCQCCENCLKFIIHIFWNILALLSILMFLVGGIIYTISIISNDFFEAISYLISSRNLLAPSPRIFDDSGPYLDVCINGDGDILDELGLSTDFTNLDLWRKASNKLDNLLNKIITKTQSSTITDTVYDEIISDLNKRQRGEVDFGFVKPNSNDQLYVYSTTSQINQALYSCKIFDVLSYSCNSEFPNLQLDNSCSSSVNTSKCIDMVSCHSNLDTKYTATVCNSANEKIEIIKEIYRTLTYANHDDPTHTNSIRNQALNIKNSYETYLNSVKTALSDYTVKFQPFHAFYDNLIGNGSLLSLINCAFIGKNVKVLLNYLDETLNKGFSALGIVFIVNGFLMLSLIVFTILLLSIIDQLDIKRNIEDELKIKQYLGGQEAKDPVDDSLRG